MGLIRIQFSKLEWMGKNAFGELRLEASFNHSSAGKVGTDTGHFMPRHISQFPDATMIIAWGCLAAVGVGSDM